MRTPIPLGALLLAVLGFTATAASTASAQVDTFEDSVDVRLVEVDVSVFDKKGRRVEGLTASDFLLFEDGDLVEIVSFEELRPVSLRLPETKRRRSAPPQSPAPPKASAPNTRAPLMALFLDEEALLTGTARTLRRSLAELLERPDAQQLDWTLLRWSGQLEVTALGTKSPEELITAVTDNRQQSGRTVQWSRLRQRALADIAATYEAAATGEDAEPCELWASMANKARIYAFDAQRLSFRRLDALELALQSLEYSGRQITLVTLSDHLNMRPGIDGFHYVMELCPLYTREIRNMLLEFDLTPQIQRIAALANAKRVTLVPIDAGGLRASSGSSVDSFLAATSPSLRNDQVYWANNQGPLTQLASETGGRAVLNTNDLTLPVLDAINQSGANYLLTFRPQRPRDGKEHRISVQLADPIGKRVEFRRGYLDRTVEQQLADHIRAYVLHGVEPQLPPATTLTVQATAQLETNTPSITVQLTVPTQSTTRLRIWAFAANDDYLTSARQQFLDLQTPTQLEFRVPLQEKHLKRGGPWRLGLGVRDEVTGEVWMERVEVRPTPPPPLG